MEYSRLFYVFIVAVGATWGATALAAQNAAPSSSGDNATENASVPEARAPGAGKDAANAADEDCD